MLKGMRIPGTMLNDKEPRIVLLRIFLIFVGLLVLFDDSLMHRLEGYSSTFSIVGFDPATGDLGVAVASKSLAVGNRVPFAKAGVGAIATQAWTNITFGPKGLELLQKGITAQEVLDALLSSDPQRERRQLAIVDAKGNCAAFTGEGILPWKGHIIGKNFTAQGNLLVSEETVKAMTETFQSTAGELVDKLLAALEAGQQAGGDKRGKQSAALLVVRNNLPTAPYYDRYVDIRVDDHPAPVKELRRIFQIYLLQR